MKSRFTKFYSFTAKSLTLFFAFFLVAGKPVALMATANAGAYEYTNNPVVIHPTQAESIAMIKQIPSTFVFSKNLKLGTSDIEVKWLQVILNADFATKVKTTGTGSAGSETYYFGPATRDALKKFQQKNSTTILTPIGLVVPTGVVGERTRTALNQVLNNLRILQSPPTTTQTSTSSSASTSINARPNYNAVTQKNEILPLTIVTNRRLAETMINADYSIVLMGTGEGPNYTWNLISGSLPQGLNYSIGKTVCEGLDCYSLVHISGRPTTVGTSTFSMSLSSNGKTITKDFSIHVGTSNPAFNQATQKQKLFARPQNVKNYSQTLDRSKKDSSISRNEALKGAVLGASTADGTGGTGGVRDVFGGNITYVQYCTCDDMILLYIYDYDLKSTIELMYIPGVSSLYEEYQVFSSGPLVLGGEQQVTLTCLVIDGEECDTYGTATGYIDTQRGVGTSLE